MSFTLPYEHDLGTAIAYGVLFTRDYKQPVIQLLGKHEKAFKSP